MVHDSTPVDSHLHKKIALNLLRRDCRRLRRLRRSAGATCNGHAGCSGTLGERRLSNGGGQREGGDCLLVELHLPPRYSRILSPEGQVFNENYPATLGLLL